MWMRLSPPGISPGNVLYFCPCRFSIFFFFFFWLLLFSVISTNLIFLGAMKSLIFENIHFLFVAGEWK